MNAKPRSKRKNTFQLKISSKFIAGLKYARDRKKSMLLSKKQKAECLLTQSSASGMEAASQDTDVLNPLPKGKFSGEITAAIKAHSSSQQLTVRGVNPHVAETSAGAECLKEAAEGCRQADAPGDHSSLPSQEQSVAAGKADKVCRGTSRAENTQMWIKEGDIHQGSWADCTVDPPRPECSVGKADKVSREPAQQSAQVGSKGGDDQLDKRPDPSLACPRQEFNVTAAAVHNSGGACADNSVQMCIKEEKVDRQEEVQVSSSKMEGKVPVLQNREPASEVHQGQELLTKTCAKFTDLPAGDCPGSLLEKKVSNM